MSFTFSKGAASPPSLHHNLPLESSQTWVKDFREIDLILNPCLPVNSCWTLTVNIAVNVPPSGSFKKALASVCT